ncbi:hypothetical protein CYFUS_008904 [Cystobacter fuscus]|uniref:Uncharacterized protein n=1 Tax=Cystobacter fuscus TaxID=43 RepID=A0A250JHQ1_9BACT|nr:hypothetical protein [Cystobacter fuscus]ATB43424.1 hypothetical protein CYFUS_008904 [Cystobacter fuscus]
MDDSERQRRVAKRWASVSLVGATILMALGIRYAPHSRPPRRRRPSAVAPAHAGEDAETPATPPQEKEKAAPVPPWLFFVLPGH